MSFYNILRLGLICIAKDIIICNKMQLILTVHKHSCVFTLLYLEGCWWCVYCISDVKCICAESYSITERKGAGWFEIVHGLVNYGVVL